MHRTIVLAACLATACLATPARAIDVSVKFSTVLKDAEGRDFRDCRRWDATKSPPFCEQELSTSLGWLAVSALSAPDKDLNLADSTRRGLLALRISDAISRPGDGELVVTDEEVKTIKDLLVKRSTPPVALVRALEILDPASLKR